MYVQRIRTQEDKKRYILLDDEFQIVDIVKDFLKYLDSRRYAENTLKNYCYHLKLYFEFLQENEYNYKELVEEKLEIKVFSEFMKWLNKVDGKVIYTQYAERPNRRDEATINAILSAVITFYDYLYRIGEVRELNIFKDGNINVFKGFLYEMGTQSKHYKINIFKLKEKDKQLQVISREQVNTLIDACKYIRDKFMIALIFESGIRLGEALGLRKSDIVIWDNKLKIVARDNKENGASVKNKAEGEIIIPSYICDLYIKYLQEEYIDNKEEYIFINLKGPNKGTAMKAITVQKLFNRLSNITGIKVNPHMLRHSHATELIEVGGWDCLDVKDRLRHRQIQTTINTYVHLSDKYKKEKYKEYQENLRKEDSSDTNK